MLIHILNLLGLLSFLGEHTERLVFEDFPGRAAYLKLLFSHEMPMPASLFHSLLLPPDIARIEICRIDRGLSFGAFALGETQIDVAWRPNFTIGLSHNAQFRFCDLDTELQAKIVLVAQAQRILINRVSIAAENMG